MIDEPDVLMAFREELARRIAKRDRTPALKPLATTPWIAMSILQKGIRRGRTDLALQAAATLLTDAPDKLWRRLGGIAFEDIGVADLDTLGLVTAALGGKRMRASLGGEWRTAAMIVEAMAAAPKCRAADDLLMSVELHPALADARRNLPALANDQLRRFILGFAPLQERSLGLWYLLGSDRRPSKHLAVRRGEPAFVFDVLDELGAPLTAVALAREGFRKTREILCPFVGLLTVDDDRPSGPIEDDDLPPETMLGPVPGWALDRHTREGRAALGMFLRTGCRTARRICLLVPAGRRVDVLCSLVFAVEGGLLAKRLRWPLGDELRRQVDIECHGLEPAATTELLDLLKADIPVLNGARAEVMGGIGYAD
jgi:hypothetical protein